MPWYALYTKPRNEKKVTEELNERGIKAYCPMVTEVKQWSDRKKRVQVPLISNYVFVQLNDKEREKVFAVNGVVRYLYWLGKPALVRDEEIKALQQAMVSTFENVNVSSRVTGEEIQVSHGLFKGQIGIVKNISNQKVQIILQQLGCVISFIT